MPAFVQPESYTARRQISLEGVTYEPGDTVPNEVVRTLPKLSALVSARILVPSTDPHQRRTKLTTPTPTDYTPPAIRAGIPDDPVE